MTGGEDVTPPEQPVKQPTDRMDTRPVTSAEIQKVEFRTRWVRPGYDEQEVDLFLDRVWWTLERIELHAKLALASIEVAWQQPGLAPRTGDALLKAKEALSWLAKIDSPKRTDS